MPIEEQMELPLGLPPTQPPKAEKGEEIDGPNFVSVEPTIRLRITGPGGFNHEAVVPRGTSAILDYLMTNTTVEAQKDPEYKVFAELTGKVAVDTTGYTHASEVPPGASSDPTPSSKLEDKTVTMIDGPLPEVLSQIGATLVPSELVPQAIGATISRLMSRSRLKMVLVTVLCDDIGVGGLSMLNPSLPANEADAVLLYGAASGHAEEFKREMQKRGVKFPEAEGDNVIKLPTLAEMQKLRKK